MNEYIELFSETANHHRSTLEYVDDFIAYDLEECTTYLINLEEKYNIRIRAVMQHCYSDQNKISIDLRGMNVICFAYLLQDNHTRFFHLITPDINLNAKSIAKTISDFFNLEYEEAYSGTTYIYKI